MIQEGSITCRRCQGTIPPGEKFCPNCGKQLTDWDWRIGAALSESTTVAKNADVRRAAKWLMVMAVIFFVFGTLYGVMAYRSGSHALASLGNLSGDTNFPLPVDGKFYTVAEVRREIHFSMYSVFGLNYLLALTMLGLYFWARKSPFPALVTALCIYLAVMVFNAVLDPKTLVEGGLLKILFLGAMIAGIKAALAARAHERPVPVARGSSA